MQNNICVRRRGYIWSFTWGGLARKKKKENLCWPQILPVVSGYKVDGGFMNLLWVFAQVPDTPTGLYSELLKSISHLLGWGILQNPGWVHQLGLFIFCFKLACCTILNQQCSVIGQCEHQQNVWYRNRIEPVLDCSFWEPVTVLCTWTSFSTFRV